MPDRPRLRRWRAAAAACRAARARRRRAAHAVAAGAPEGPRAGRAAEGEAAETGRSAPLDPAAGRALWAWVQASIGWLNGSTPDCNESVPILQRLCVFAP